MTIDSLTIDDVTVETFRRRLNGPLLRPSDAGFAAATQLWNGMIEKTPALVVSATGTADVVAAIAGGGLTIDMS